MPDLRPAREDDITRLMEIRAAVRENRLQRLVIGPDDYGPYLRDDRCWVWEKAGRIHGFAALDVGTASVWALFVDPAAQGRGIGRTLLDRMIAEARARGLAALTLETEAGTRAEAFYLRAGWQPVDGDGAGTRRFALNL